jgi:hypothetical protein
LVLADDLANSHIAEPFSSEGFSKGICSFGRDPVAVPSRLSELGDEDASLTALVAIDGEGDGVCTVPLRAVHPGDVRVQGGSTIPSTWVLEMVTSFRHLVGVSCDGYEDDLMHLFAALEVERGKGKSGGKLLRELKSLESSVNYDGSSSGSRRSRKVGRALVTSL